jgi:hypothetical protein
VRASTLAAAAAAAAARTTYTFTRRFCRQILLLDTLQRHECVSQRFACLTS